MTPLPRSALLSLWAGPALVGRVDNGALVRAVQGDDEPHEVLISDAERLPALAVPGRLGELVSALREQQVRALRLVLPVPGDPSALPGPRAVNEAAIEAGECVVTVGGPPLVIVPEVYEFGSVYEPGHQVAWRVLDCSPQVSPIVLSVGDAERELREALLQAAEVLSGLDIASWRPDAAEQVDGLRTQGVHGLPQDTPPRAARVLDLAWRVRSIVELARQDHGGSVNGWEAARRDDELRRLEYISRRAVVAAVNAPIRD